MPKITRSLTVKAIRLAILLLVISFVSAPSTHGQDSVIRCVLFYSPTCPHCHEVITQTLPPLIEVYGGTPEVLYIPPSADEEAAGPAIIGMYGETLEILYINTLTQVGSDLFWEAVDLYQIPEERQVVPLMIIDEIVLIGGIEIPEMFSEHVDAGVNAGGRDWPDLPGLTAAITQLVDLPSEDELPAATSVAIVPEDEPTVPPLITDLSILDKIQLDPLGNGIAIVVLVGMLITVAYVGSTTLRGLEKAEGGKPSTLIPVLSFIGLLVAIYLSFVEASGIQAVCGPIGDCNIVQQSQYSRLFGLIPVGIVGLVGYLGISLAWFIARLSSGRTADLASAALFLMTSIGILYSIYLTFLEPFVIGATCAWCLSSAVIMTMLFWITKDLGVVAFNRLRRQ